MEIETWAGILPAEGVQEITLLPWSPRAGKELNALGSFAPVQRSHSENRFFWFCRSENSPVNSLGLPNQILIAKISYKLRSTFLLPKYYSPTLLTNTCRVTFFLLLLVFWPCKNPRLKSLLNHIYFFLWLSGLWNWRVALGPNTAGIYLFREKCGLIHALKNKGEHTKKLHVLYKAIIKKKIGQNNVGQIQDIIQHHKFVLMGPNVSSLKSTTVSVRGWCVKEASLLQLRLLVKGQFPIKQKLTV